jgi:spermidine/putrescine transport system permease protein
MSSWLPKSAAGRRWLGLAPSYIVIGIFMLVPMLIMGVFSFLEANPYGGVKPVISFDAYIKLLFEYDLDDSLIFNSGYLNIIRRSFQLSVMATLLCLFFGFPVAYYITLQPENKRNFYIYLITIPFWTNLLIRTFAWIIILGRGGVIEIPLLELGIIEKSLRMMYSDGAIAIGLTYSYLPLMVLPIYASLEKLDFRLLEAASDLYASRWETMVKIVIPLCKPGIIAGCILVFIPCLGAFIAPNLLGGGKKLMLGSLVQFQFSSARNWPFGAALSMLLLLVVIISLIFYARAAKKRYYLEGEA